jgi:putative transposase
MLKFVRWYNHADKRRNLKFVSQAEHHCGEDAAIFIRRIAVYEVARANHPERWSKTIRGWSLRRKSG